MEESHGIHAAAPAGPAPAELTHLAASDAAEARKVAAMNDKTPQLCKAVHRPSSVWCDREVGHKGQHRGDTYSNDPRETIRWRTPVSTP